VASPETEALTVYVAGGGEVVVETLNEAPPPQAVNESAASTVKTKMPDFILPSNPDLPEMFQPF
jgi:hypothetical protein